MSNLDYTRRTEMLNAVTERDVYARMIADKVISGDLTDMEVFTRLYSEAAQLVRELRGW